MEQIRSGQSFLYRDGGLNSTVLDVRMKHKIRGDFLKRALDITLQRYPYMMNKLREKDGVFYFEKCPLPMKVVKTEKYRTLSSMSTGYHLLDVTYTGHSIRVAFHHALCDGRGIRPFLETLIYYYCCFIYNRNFNSTGIRLAEEPMLPGETQEPIGRSKYEVDESKLPQVIKNGFSLPENTEDCSNYYRYEININKNDFIRFAKDNNATPAILLALLISSSIRKRYPEADKPVVCSMAMDYRNEVGCENTHKNCVGSLYLPYSEDNEYMTLAESATLYRKMMKEQRQPEAIKALVNSQIGLLERLEDLHTLTEKQQALSFFNDMCIDTYVISYLGQIELGEHAEYVESIHLYNSGVKGLRINMISAGAYITVDVLQNFEADDFISGFLDTLDKIKFRYSVSERILFETTKDKSHITAGRQAKRYFKLEPAVMHVEISHLRDSPII